MRRSGGHSGVRSPVAAVDAALVILLALAPIVLHLGDLGFHSDDWAFLEYLHNADDRSIAGLFRAATSPSMAMRPVLVLLFAVCYKLFGLDPTPYHVLNALLLGGMGVGLLLSLRELGLRPAVAFATAAVFVLLPHYSANRFWITTGTIVLSGLLYTSSLYADLRAARARPGKLAAWKAAAIAALLIGSLAYEIFLPLYVLNLLAMELSLRRSAASAGDARRPSLRRRLALYVPNLATLAAVGAFKALTTTRLHALDPYWQLRWFARLLADSAAVAWGRFGVGLPSAALEAVAALPGSTLAFAALLALAVFLRLMGPDSRAADPGHRLPLGLLAAGLATFIAGYAVFLTNRNALVTPTGIANRIALAGAIGVALWWAAIGSAVDAVWSALRRAPARPVGTATVSALLCAGGFLVNAWVGSFWTRAWEREQEVLAATLETLPHFPSGTTLLLDGVCPYVGPAVVFESNWDLAGALATLYEDTSIRADVVTPKLTVGDEGLSTVLYGSIRAEYPYGRDLFVLRFPEGDTVGLPDRGAAASYFSGSESYTGDLCPPGRAGFGVPVL